MEVEKEKSECVTWLVNPGASASWVMAFGFHLFSSVGSHSQQRFLPRRKEGPEELQQLRFGGVWSQDSWV